MPVPKRKRSRTRRDKRFANKGMKVHAITQCNNCQTPIVPHIACSTCGHYKGVKIMVSKLDRAIKRAENKKTVKNARTNQAGIAPVEQAKES